MTTIAIAIVGRAITIYGEQYRKEAIYQSAKPTQKIKKLIAIT